MRQTNLSEVLCCSSQGEGLDIIRKCINRRLDGGSELMGALTNVYLISI